MSVARISTGTSPEAQAGTAAATVRPHGIRAKYVHEGCRCQQCRRATAEYEKRRVRRNAYGLSPWVDAEPVRAHVRSLMSSGVGANDGMSYKRIASLAGVGNGTVGRLLYGRAGKRAHGPSKRIHKDIAAKLLAVKERDLAGGALVDARQTWEMVEELTSFGMSRASIARTIGKKDPRLQLSRERVTVTNARAVEELHWTVFKASAPFRRLCSCPVPGSVAEWLEEADGKAERLRRAGVA